MTRLIRIIFIMGSLILILAGVYLYQSFYKKPVVTEQLEDPYIHIPTGSSYEEVKALLKEKGVLGNELTFDKTADYMNYIKEPMRSGRFKLEKGWTMVELIRHLRSGKQAPVDVVLTNERLIEDVAGKVAGYIEPDSAALYELLTDPGFLEEIGYTRESLMSLFIPNTYEVYWDSSPRQFAERMIREHKLFWNRNNRKEKAEKLGMTTNEVYTLASIVEKETLINEEKKRMAGVYLNRLDKGMRLQADPTAVFARRDFDTPRVTHYHTKFDSPYNTYMYAGLPPGPIAMASITSIDAVLNAEDHDYLYFCAVGDGSGLHNFARTLSQHNRNAEIYRNNLRKRGLR